MIRHADHCVFVGHKELMHQCHQCNVRFNGGWGELGDFSVVYCDDCGEALAVMEALAR